MNHKTRDGVFVIYIRSGKVNQREGKREVGLSALEFDWCISRENGVMQEAGCHYFSMIFQSLFNHSGLHFCPDRISEPAARNSGPGLQPGPSVCSLGPSLQPVPLTCSRDFGLRPEPATSAFGL